MKRFNTKPIRNVVNQLAKAICRGPVNHLSTLGDDMRFWSDKRSTGINRRILKGTWYSPQEYQAVCRVLEVAEVVDPNWKFVLLAPRMTGTQEVPALKYVGPCPFTGKRP